MVAHKESLPPNERLVTQVLRPVAFANMVENAQNGTPRPKSLEELDREQRKEAFSTFLLRAKNTIHKLEALLARKRPAWSLAEHGLVALTKEFEERRRYFLLGFSTPTDAINLALFTDLQKRYWTLKEKLLVRQLDKVEGALRRKTPALGLAKQELIQFAQDFEENKKFYLRKPDFISQIQPRYELLCEATSSQPHIAQQQVPQR